MPTCIALVGYPGVGKSTSCKKYKAEGWTIISGIDATKVIQERHGITEAEACQPQYGPEQRELLEGWIQEAVAQNKNIVIDMLNTSVLRRAWHLNLFKEHGPDYRMEALVIHPPEEEEHASRLIRRAFEGTHTDVLDGAFQTRLAQDYALPTCDEGYAAVNEIGVAPKKSLFVSL